MECMMNFEQLIMNGIRNLPQERLKEVAEFVYFIRQKAFEPEKFQEGFEAVQFADVLTGLNHAESIHLESEFENYQETYPKE